MKDVFDLTHIGLNASYPNNTGDQEYYEDSDGEERVAIIEQDDNKVTIAVRQLGVEWKVSGSFVFIERNTLAITTEIAALGYLPAINYLRIQKLEAMGI